MSDVEKAISGLVEDEELLQQHQQQNLQPTEQQQSTAPSNKININNYNLQNETGNSSLLQKQSGNNDSQQQHHPHQHTIFQQQLQRQQQDTNTNTNASYLTAKQHNNCLSRVAKLIFSTPGLVVMVVVYTIMGAFIFPLLEAPQDISKSALIAKSREECLKELWIITEKLNVLYERNWTMLVHEQLRRFEGTIVAATRNMAVGTTASSSGSSGGGGGVQGFGMATETTTTTLGRYGGNNLMEYSDLTTTRWSFSEALLYSVTVITTIGHGSLTPRTAGGKIATIFYALIGVPLMLMCLSSLGALLAEALQCTYARLCCRWPQYVVNDAEDFDNDTRRSKHLQSQRIKRQHGCTSRAEINAEKETSHQIRYRLQHQCDFQDHKNDINCKNCKYDAIIGETNTNHGYDYKLCNDATITATSPSLSSSTAAAVAAPTTTTAMTTIKLGHKEDCCQLLQNSSGKFAHHLSSCMQLKMSPTMTVSGGTKDTATAQKQEQQQQYYQQRPDVMLMATGHKLSSQQPATMATACHVILPPSLPASQTQRFYANATPAMATYHLVSSASANSSPTHQQSIRHYIVPQMPPSPLPSTSSLLPAPSSTSVMGTQHFMAVPSSMLRFHHQTSPQTSIQQPQQQCSGNTTTSNININPLALPVSGSAAVYFPIVTPAAANSQNSNQPSFKYHTLQLPHKRHQGLSLLQQTDLHHNQVINAVEDVDGSLFPPPPPPAYQTATVHGIRRAKFLTKPQSQEINSLQHESDISCRHDLSQNLTTFNNNNNSNDINSGGEQQQQQLVAATVYTPTTHSVLLSNENEMKTKISMPTTTAVNSFPGSSNASTTTASSSPASTATPTINTNSNNTTNIYENYESAIAHSLPQQQQQTTHVVNNNQMGLILVSEVKSSEGAVPAAMVDIMEDEEEQEQQRLSDFPHGTPSRVPLLTSSSNTAEDKAHARNFLNATAASFHRHTLNTFQRSNSSTANQRKSIIINRKGECNLHEPKRGNYSRATVYYGDKYDDISDDDCGGLEGDNIYKLKHLHHAHPTHSQTDKHLNQADFCDNHSLVSLSDSTSQTIPQVPIILVLFILTFYVCLGTVIFALWENWSLIDGAYFCFVTLTTIGYGDFVPWRTFQGPDIQLFACCAYLLLGLVLVAMAFSILETQLIWKCKRLAVRLKLAKE